MGFAASLVTTNPGFPTPQGTNTVHNSSKSPRRLPLTAAAKQPFFGTYSGQVEAIMVHHLCPRRHEVFRELLLGIRARIDFRE
jgi:hypothetical protein